MGVVLLGKYLQIQWLVEASRLVRFVLKRASAEISQPMFPVGSKGGTEFRNYVGERQAGTSLFTLKNTRTQISSPSTFQILFILCLFFILGLKELPWEFGIIVWQDPRSQIPSKTLGGGVHAGRTKESFVFGSYLNVNSLFRRRARDGIMLTQSKTHVCARTCVIGEETHWVRKFSTIGELHVCLLKKISTYYMYCTRETCTVWLLVHGTVARTVASYEI